MRPGIRNCLLAAAVSLCASLVEIPIANAEPTNSYARVSKLYSTMDAGSQAIELELVAVNSTPLVLAGRVLTVRDRSGNVRLAQTLSGKFDGPILRPNLLLATFADDQFDGIPSASADVLIEPPNLNISLDPANPHVWFVARIPIDGGTIEIEGMDTWAFGPLPLSGMQALARDGSAVPSILHRYTRTPFVESENYATIWEPGGVFAVEYYHEGMDHYFLTALSSEMELLDGGQVPGWTRTGFQLHVFARPTNSISESAPVCRFLKDYPGGYSHILSSLPFECSLLAADSSNTFESGAVFHVVAADPTTGNCPAWVWIDDPLEGSLAGYSPSYPVYRFWNGLSNGNHRYVTDQAERAAMRGKGWISEGYGSDGVAFCN